jgi:hypothetical protein
MTNQHPITVPLDLIEDWRLAPEFCDGKKKIVMITVSRERMQFIADQAAQWGANQELEACCEWIEDFNCSKRFTTELRTARRPKLKSQAEEALMALEQTMILLMPVTGRKKVERLDTIRAALERLRELEKTVDD